MQKTEQHVSAGAREYGLVTLLAFLNNGPFCVAISTSQHLVADIFKLPNRVSLLVFASTV